MENDAGVELIKLLCEIGIDLTQKRHDGQGGWILVIFSDEFAGSNIASKFIKMPKTGFRNVISGKTRWQDHFKVFEIY